MATGGADSGTLDPLDIRGEIAHRASRSLIIAAVLLAAGPVIFALTSFESHYVFRWYRYFSIPIVAMEIGILIAAAASGFRPLQAFSKISPPAQITALVFLAGIAVSTTRAVVPNIAAGHLALTSIHAAVALTLWDRLTSSWLKGERLLLIATGLGAALFAIAAYLLLFSVRDQADFNWINQGVGGSYMRHLSFYGVVAGGLGSGLLVTAKNRSVLWMSFAMLLLGTALTAWSGGRGGFGAILLALVAAAILAPFEDRWPKITIACVAILGGCAVSMLWVPPSHHWGLARILGSSLTEYDSLDDFTTGRWAQWRESWRLFLEQPLFGNGEGQNAYISRVTSNWTQPHNFILQFLVQWGLVGNCALAFLVGKSLLSAMANLRSSCSTVVPAICCAVAICGVALLDAALFYAYGMITLTICLVCMSVPASIELREA
ncbi:MAG: O-antigen ligase family protein [Erythrobacter sp.]